MARKGIRFTTDRPRLLATAACSVALSVLAACAGFQTYEPLPVDVEYDFSEIQAHDLTDAGLAEFLRVNGYEFQSWPLASWDLNALTLAALYFKPEMKIARAEWARMQAMETTAAQQPNPVINLPLEWHSETADNVSHWTVGIVLDLILERSGKRQARIDQAVMQSLGARIEAEHTAWRLHNSVVTTLLNYLSAAELHDQLQGRLKVADEIMTVLERRERAGETGSFELSAARLDLQRNRLALIEQTRLKESALVELAAAVGVTPEVVGSVTLTAPDLMRLPVAEELPAVDVHGLALLQRYDIRKALVDYSVAEAALRLEIEKQYPDITLSPGFIFDQHDLIWALGSSWLLPLLHSNEGEIAEALAARELQRQQLSGLQARIMQDVYRARSEYLGLYASYGEALELQRNAEEYRRKVEAQYHAGHTDKLELLRAQLERVETGRIATELQGAMLRAFAALEDSLQFSVLWPVMLPQPEPEPWTSRATAEAFP